VETPRPRLRCLTIVGALARGGAERQAMLATRAMADAGVEPLVLVCRGPLHQADDLAALGIRSDLPANGERIAAQLVRLRRALGRLDPDAVVTFQPSAGVRYALARMTMPAGRTRAWIYSARGNQTLADTLREPVRSAFRDLCLRGAHRVVVNSSSLAANAIAMAPAVADKLEVIPNVVLPFEADPAAARARLAELVNAPAASPLVGAVGSFRSPRNYPLLARAFRLVLREHPRAHLAVLGRTTGPECEPEARRFRSICAELGISARVTTPGEIPGARALIAGFDAFVLPSRLEGSSNALAEAIVAGAAVATVPVADAEELLGRSGVVAGGWTPELLARATLAVLANVPHWRSLAQDRRRELLAARAPERVGARWASAIAAAVDDARARPPAALDPCRPAGGG
jgi:glycosyltransferase involved in cell wall biosynthesis